MFSFSFEVYRSGASGCGGRSHLRREDPRRREDRRQRVAAPPLGTGLSDSPALPEEDADAAREANEGHPWTQPLPNSSGLPQDSAEPVCGGGEAKRRRVSPTILGKGNGSVEGWERAEGRREGGGKGEQQEAHPRAVISHFVSFRRDLPFSGVQKRRGSELDEGAGAYEQHGHDGQGLLVEQRRHGRSSSASDPNPK